MKRQILSWFTAVVFTLPSVGLAYAQVPTIYSFSPTSGIIGTSVTIMGISFNATATQNIVFFWATKATSSGSINSSSFVSPVNFATGLSTSFVNICDWDGEFDLMVSNYGLGHTISVLRNNPPTAPPSITPSGSLVVSSSSTSTLPARGCAGTVTWL